LGFLGLLKFKIGLKAFKSWALITGLKKIIKFYYISLLKFWGGPLGLNGSFLRPIGLCPIFRPVGLGLGVLFSKKPKPKPDLWACAQDRPNSNSNLGLLFRRQMRCPLHLLRRATKWAGEGL
jgi:hypothetical protein